MGVTSSRSGDRQPSWRPSLSASSARRVFAFRRRAHDGFHHAFVVLLNVAVPEAPHSVSLLRQPDISARIALTLGMLAAIRLDRQAVLKAAEVAKAVLIYRAWHDASFAGGHRSAMTVTPILATLDFPPQGGSELHGSNPAT